MTPPSPEVGPFNPKKTSDAADLPTFVNVSRRSPLWPSGDSKVVGVIGDPISHTLSPMLHNAAFDVMGLSWVSVAFRVRDGHLSDALAGMRALEIVGLSVTTPHKEAAAGAVDSLTPLASRLGAVNCVTRLGAQLAGDSTDGEGFLASLARGADFEAKGKRCAVIGAGGAARAVMVALADAGAAEVVVVNRSRERAERAARLAGSVVRTGTPEEISDMQLVVQATSLGMAGDRSVPAGADRLNADQLAVDIVYEPALTPFLEVARGRGAKTLGGLGMLVHQAALAIERWTGTDAPVEEMWNIAEGRSRL